MNIDATAVDGGGNLRPGEGGGGAVGQARRGGFQLLIDAGALQFGQGGDAGGHGQGVAGQGAGLVHRAQRGYHLHYIAASAVGADGQPAADDFAQCGNVGRDAVEGLGAAVGDAESGNHFVKDQQGAVVGGDLAQAGQKAGGRRRYAHIAGDGLHDDGGDGVGPGVKQAGYGCEVVVVRNQGFGGVGFGDAGAGRHARGSGRRSRPAPAARRRGRGSCRRI